MFVRKGSKVGSILLHDRRVGSASAGKPAKAPEKAPAAAPKAAAAAKTEAKAQPSGTPKKEG